MSDSKSPSDFILLRRNAIRFWERGRILYLVFLALAVGATTWLHVELTLIFDDKPPTFGVNKFVAFSIWFVLANIAFSLIYAVEFLFLATRFHQRLLNSRKLILVHLILLGVFFAWQKTLFIAAM